MNQWLRPKFSAVECLRNFKLDVVAFNIDQPADAFRIVIDNRAM